MFVETRSGGDQVIFAENRSTMLEIESDIYADVAEKFADAIGGSEYFSGSVSCSHGGVEYVLTATVLIYRRGDGMPEGKCGTVTDIIPVWWEFSTIAPDGCELVNGFSFAELKKYFLDIYQTSDNIF